MRTSYTAFLVCAGLLLLLAPTALLAASVPTPTFAPDSGTYTGAQNVIVRCAMDGVTIRYTSNGAAVSETSTIVPNGGTVRVERSLTLKAKAWKTGYTSSQTRTAQYTINLMSLTTPTFTPGAGTYSGPQSVIVRCADGATIRYTINGAAVSETSTIVANGETVGVTRSLTLKARAWKAGYLPSETKTAVYTIAAGKVQLPYFGPDAGTYTTAQTVTVRCATAGSTIRYTTNGGIPTETSPIVSNGGTVRVEKSLVLKAKAWRGGWTASEVKSAEYSIGGSVATPVFTPDSGIYVGAQSVKITCNTGLCTIRYTTNGAEPTGTNTAINNGGSISVSKNMTVKAKAWKTGLTPSAVKTATYAIKVATPSLSLNSGTYVGARNVIVRCETPEVTIRYTTNSTTPLENSPIVTNGGTIRIEKSLMLQVRAWKTNWTSSAVKVGEYTITK